MASKEDTAWKEILDRRFEEFLEFFFPEIHKDIDWDKGVEFLDKELEPILRTAGMGRQIADKLAKVRLLDGSEPWIFIHVEVQGRSERRFIRRMYDYNYMIHRRYDQDVVSLAVLTDPSRSFRPEGFEWRLWGFEIVFRFPTVKLLDYDGRRDELEESRNPFALVVLASLEARKARDDPERFRVKLGLIRRLYAHGWGRENIIVLFRFVDWLMRLPRDLEEELLRKVKEISGEATMPYLSSLERFAMERGKKEGRREGKLEGKLEGKREGLREGLLQAIELGLKLRFGDGGLSLLPRVQAISEIRRLRTLIQALSRSRSLEEFTGLLGEG